MQGDERTGLCLAGALNTLPILSSSFAYGLGAVRVAALDVDSELPTSVVEHSERHRARSILLVAPNDGRGGAKSTIFDNEVQCIAAHHTSASRRVRMADQDRDDLRTQFESANIIHVAAHCVSDLISPMKSWIDLGWTRIEAGELASWNLSKVECLVLAACDTGNVGVSLPNEIFGFVGASLKAGVADVVASSFPVPSESTLHLMDAMHQALSRGLHVSDALRAAQQDVWSRAMDVNDQILALVGVGGFEVHSALSRWAYSHDGKA